MVPKRVVRKDFILKIDIRIAALEGERDKEGP